jgi:uncharacterized repeat protein (TIGR01451 family)
MNLLVSRSAAPGMVITNVAEVSTPPDPELGSRDPYEDNDTAFASTTIPGGSTFDLEVMKTADSDQAVSGSNVRYTITVTNSGGGNALNAQLTDPLPGDMTFVSLTRTSGPTWQCTTPAAGAGGTVSCTNSSLPSGQTVFVLTGHIPAGEAAGTTYDNTVFVNAANDTNPENDTSTASTVAVNAAPTLTTQASPSVMLGGSISDTATLSGGQSPTGEILFAVYGPDDTNCGSAPAATGTVTVTGNGQYNSGSWTPSAAGTYRFVANYGGDLNNKSVSTTCNDPNESVVVTPLPAAQALNLATRLKTETGDNVMIGGFIITGQASKSVVLRGLGPSLVKFGLTDLLLDPVLELRGPNGFSFVNDDWKQSPQRAQFEGTLYQPSDDRESVIMATLAPAIYTAILTGKGQTTGIGTLEIYDNDQAANSQLAQMSTRGFVQTGNKVMIGGFSLGGNNVGTTRIAIRGRGPSLTGAGVSNILADPMIEVRDPNGTVLAANDDWQSDQVMAQQLSANGLGMSDSREAGLFGPLPPGQYTAILSGKDGGMGNGIIEIYNLK